MEKIWYIILNGATLGPFSFLELRAKPDLTPDTLCWKEGFKDWVPIRQVPELKDLFKDPVSLHPDETEEIKNGIGNGEIAMDVQDPNFNLWFWWLLIAALILIYLLSKFY